MEKEESVDVYYDRPYYIVEYVDGEIKMKECFTTSMTTIIDTLNKIKDMSNNAILISCCYSQYKGSYNVIVDAKAQYEKIFKYATDKYKTFLSKYNS